MADNEAWRRQRADELFPDPRPAAAGVQPRPAGGQPSAEVIDLPRSARVGPAPAASSRWQGLGLLAIVAVVAAALAGWYLRPLIGQPIAPPPAVTKVLVYQPATSVPAAAPRSPSVQPALPAPESAPSMTADRGVPQLAEATPVPDSPTAASTGRVDHVAILRHQRGPAAWKSVIHSRTQAEPFRRNANAPRISGAAHPAVVPFTRGPAIARPSFNCRRAASDTARLICADPTLAALDVQLSRDYHRLAGAVDRNTERELDTDQATFLNRRARCVSRGCLIDAYRDRIEQLGGDPSR